MAGIAGRPCRCCAHPEREKIDSAIVARATSFRRISLDFAVSERSLRRHADAHVSSAAQREAARAVVVASDERVGSVTQQAIALHATAMRILAKAEAAGDLRAALAGVREAARCVELVGKLVGEIDQNTTINVITAPAFLATRAAMMCALAPFPEARAAVVAALEQVR